MDLAAARRRLGDDPAAADLLVEEAEVQVRETLAELRALSRGIAPPVLTDRGLAAALASLAGRCTVQVTLDVALPDSARLPDAVEEAAYFVVSEALTNVAKHSGAGSCVVHVSRAVDAGRSALHVVVEDDGVGGAHPAKGHGLSGLRDRLAGVDGTLEVRDRQGGGTRVEAVVPCG
jgi:signal transduction histidine kinase